MSCDYFLSVLVRLFDKSTIDSNWSVCSVHINFLSGSCVFILSLVSNHSDSETQHLDLSRAPVLKVFKREKMGNFR